MEAVRIRLLLVITVYFYLSVSWEEPHNVIFSNPSVKRETIWLLNLIIRGKPGEDKLKALRN